MEKRRRHPHPESRRGAIPTYLLTAVLALLTLVSIYIGNHRTNQRSIEAQKRRQEEQARRILDAMSLHWRLRDQISIHASRILAKLEDLTREQRMQIAWPSLSSEVRRRFQGSRVWMFDFRHAPPGTPPRIVDAPAGGPIGRQAMLQAFHHIVRHHAGQRGPEAEERRNAKLLTTLFGNDMDVVPLSQSLRGIPIKVITGRVQQYLVWDMIADGTTPVAGFVILVPDTTQAAATAMRISAAAVRSGTVRWNGFVRAHPSRIGDLFPRPLPKSRALQAWCSKYRAIPFREREHALPPWGEFVGRYRIYTRAMLNSSHIAAVLLPVESPPAFPLPLKAVGLAFGVGGGLLLVRGLLLGTWPAIPLAWRFAGLYFLACAFPLSLAIQTCSGYVDERRETLMRSLERRLSSTLSTIDQSKGELENRYLATFLRILASDKWRKAVALHGIQAPGLAEWIVGEFANASPSLPLSAMFLFDMQGNELATRSSMLTSEQVDGIHRFYRISLVNVLRKRYQLMFHRPPAGDDPLSPRDVLFWNAFTQITNSNVMQHMEIRRSVPEFIKAGSHWLVKLHEFVTTDAGGMIAFVVAWHDKFLEKEAVRSAMIEFSRMIPDGMFLAYRKEYDRLVPLTPASSLQRRVLEGPARVAMEQGGVFATSAVARDEWFVLAGPSRAMRDVWLAAALPVRPEFAAFEARRRQLLGFLLLSLTIVIFLGVVTARHVVPSIQSVKTGLMAVTSGDLDIRVKLDRPDELGVLTQAFDEMTDGLRQRQRLSTFVSGAALQAISAGTTEKPRRGPGIVLVSDIRSFTTLCENQPAPAITGMLNRHFDLMAEIVHRFGGRIDRFIGDAIQAVFEPNSSDDGSLERRAIMAGLSMLERMDSINDDRRAAGLFPYAIGVGLSRGELLFGGIGDPALRFEISIIGNAVAEATGLETLSKSAPGLPLVMTPEIAEAGGALTASAVPLSGHDSRAFVYRGDVTARSLLRPQGGGA
ncbi:MAG TPA: adenylate/guanylate cyclase domain-containing protein [Candidatus Ozemobacteraceae bacterium]|nr:adenylate/guanylate cyclase domain-containing protein [Candidatus Ozemobacteraceae bacterium]